MSKEPKKPDLPVFKTSKPWVVGRYWRRAKIVIEVLAALAGIIATIIMIIELFVR